MSMCMKYHDLSMVDICMYMYTSLEVYIQVYITINKVKVAGFFIPKTHMASRLILFSELTSGK